eukprot:SAG22_NODE_2273_length_2766_cov_2.731159_2_plen_112_part_00
MDIVQIKQLRKAIRQNNFDKKLFLGFVTDYTESIYKKSSQKNIDKAMQLILDRGPLPDGAVDMEAYRYTHYLHYLVSESETDALWERTVAVARELPVVPPRVEGNGVVLRH